MTRAFEEAADLDIEMNDPSPTGYEGSVPGDVRAQAMQLGPGDDQALAQLLAQYPEQQSELLSLVAPRVGNATVQRALARLRGETPVRPSPDGEAFANQLFREENTKPAPTPPSAEGEAFANQLFREENSKPAPTPPSAEGEAFANQLFREENSETGAEFQPAAQKPVSAWDGAARYNAAHQHLVDEFNSLTEGTCVGRDGGVDPELVAKWQSSHDLVADGKVGPMTVAAAHHAAEAKQAETPQAPNIEEIEEELE